ncbi:MAG: hypothetical protein V7785_10060 [Bermanella sp.]
MKFSSKACLVTLLMGGLSFSQVQAEDKADQTVGQQIDSALTAVKEFTVDNKDKAVEAMASALTRLDERIDVLEEKIQNKWNTMDDKTQKEARQSLDLLREKRASMANWIAEMKASGSETWDNMKNGISEAFHALQNSDEETEENTKPAKIITI